MTDEQLLARFREHGDRAALSELIARYSPRLRRLLYSLLGGDVDAVQDAEQEIYVTLIRRASRFRGASRFSTFFYALARNRAIDLMRKRQRERDRVIAYESADLFAGAGRDPESLAVRNGEVEHLMIALGRLKPADRFLLAMKDGEDATIEELCEMTGEPAGTIKSRLARARSKVRSFMKECGP